MSLPAPFPKQSRKRLSRSTDGCLCCRTRRKKCDGNKPACSRCVRTKSTCQWPERAKDAHTTSSDAQSGIIPQQSISNHAHIAPHALIHRLRFHNGPISELSSRHVVRSQLRAISAILFGPDPFSRTFSPLWAMVPIHTGQDDAFTFAFDALALAQVGTFHRDGRLLWQAIQTYFKAIQKLQLELQALADSAKMADSLLSTPYLLFLCSRFSLISDFHCTTNSTAHLSGWGRLLNATGKPLSRLQLLLTHDYCSYILELCMLGDQDMLIQNPLISPDTIEAMPSYCAGLVQFFMRAPPLLREARRLISAHLQAQETGPVLALKNSRIHQELGKIERDGSSYFRIWLAVDSPDTYVVVETALLSTHDTELDLLSASVFKTAFDFPSFAAAKLFKQFWQHVHIIQDTRNQLENLMSRQSYHESSYTDHSITELADNICRVIIYLCGTSTNGSHGYYCASGAIRYVRPWYLIQGQLQKALWCDFAWAFLSKKYVKIADRNLC